MIHLIQRVVVDSTVISHEVQALGDKEEAAAAKSAPSMTAKDGTPQSARMNKPFEKLLSAMVKDSTGKPTSNVLVTT
ncbi:MAG: hypothetical protein WA673_08120 [Candidatus Acidiferrales bacterium]